MTWIDRYCEDLCKSHMIFYQNELRFFSHTVYDPKLTLIWLSQRNFFSVTHFHWFITCKMNTAALKSAEVLQAKVSFTH